MNELFENDDVHQKIMRETADRLGWKVTKDGFLIHPLTDEFEAQKIWNSAYEQVRNEG